MRETWIIVRREFLERVRTRAFVIGTIAFPVFMVAVFVMPRMMAGGSVERTFARVDEAPFEIGTRFESFLDMGQFTGSGNQYTMERVAGTAATSIDTLNARVMREELDGYVVLPADIMESNRFVFRARSIANQVVVRDLRNAASEAVQAARLRAAGLDRADMTDLLRRVDVDDAAVTDTGEAGRSAESTFMFAYILAFLIYFITAIYGTSVLRSVLEEKTNRIAEVLVSSVNASRLMMGKVVGVGSAALFQVAIWTGAIILIATRSDLIARGAGVPVEVFAALSIPAGQAVLFILFFTLGFLLFSAVFAAAGAALTSEQEAQSVQMPLMLPLFLPLLVSFRVTAEPMSGMAVALGLFPLTSPITMPMRIAAAPIPAGQIAASLGLLVLGLFFMAWAGGKIFRIGILSTGARPSLRDLVRWVREA